MSKLVPVYLALVGDADTFDPAAHARRDLLPVKLELTQREGELALATLEVKNPRAQLSTLDGRRIIISTSGRVLFDGVLQSVPRGAVGETLTLEAVAQPADRAVLDAQLASLGEALKQAPGWDPLFVPDGAEDDIAELLAGYQLVLAYSRIAGVPSLCDPVGGSSTLAVKPLVGSVEIDATAGVPRTIGFNLTASWTQLGSQDFEVGPYDLEISGGDALMESWPRKGASIGDGFLVTDASARKKSEIMKVTNEDEVARDELDPAFLDEEKSVRSLTVDRIGVSAGLSYRFEVSRTETAEIAMTLGVQPAAPAAADETEDVTLRDLTETDDVPAWRSGKDYTEDDQVIDGGNVYSARRDHRSGDERLASDWSLVGPAKYLTSRRISSFFGSARGSAALAHAAARIRARAVLAARAYTVSFEARMPKPWLVTHDMTVSLASAELPGCYAEGRLVEYSISWDGGKKSFAGTIACSVGTGAADTSAITVDPGSPPYAGGRVAVRRKNCGGEQLSAFNAGNSIPAASVEIETIPVAATELEHEVAVTSTGLVGLKKQVSL